MKRIIAILLMAVCLISCYSCTNNNNKDSNETENDIVSVNITEIAQKLNDSIDFEEELTQIDNELAKDMYGFNSDNVIVYYGSGATAEMVLVAQYSSSDKANNGIKYIEKFIEEQKDTYSSYAPLAMKNLENSVIQVCFEKYVICVVSSDVNAQTKINQSIK